MQPYQSSIVVTLAALSLSVHANARSPLPQFTDWTVGPGQSIQGAIDDASDGDRILVLAGSYNEIMNLHGKQLQVIGVDGADDTVIDGTGLDGPIFYVGDEAPSGTLIRGFTLTHGRGWFAAPGPNTVGGGIAVFDGAQLRIEECRITENGVGTCTFGGGVYAHSGVPTENVTHAVLYKCEISHNDAWAHGGACMADWGSMMTLEQCTITENTSTDSFGLVGGFSLAKNSQGWVSNSILWGSLGSQIAFWDSTPTVTVTYSDIQGGAVGTGNIDADPLFVNAESGDYHLGLGSLCIDAGDPNAPLDCDGTIADLGSYGPFCDCNGNNLPDDQDISTGTSTDCDQNGVPDECEYSDCDADGVNDLCEILSGAEDDCNENGVPDWCDVAYFTSEDCNANFVPDECEEVPDTCECQVNWFCSTSPNSVGPGMQINFEGTLSVGANDLILTASGGPVNQPGIFYYGALQMNGGNGVPFGQGIRCVGGSGPIFRVQGYESDIPYAFMDSAGNATKPVDMNYGSPASGPGQIQPGSIFSFQFWYRDPTAGPHGLNFNLSDAMELTFCP